MKKTISGVVFILMLSTLGLVYINYNPSPLQNIPQKQKNIPNLYYPSSLTELTTPLKILDGANSTPANYRQPTKRIETKERTYQLLNQNSIDHIIPNIDKSTLATKYMKKGVYFLVDKKTQERLLQITIGNPVSTVDNACSVVANTPNWRNILNVKRLRSCTYQWLQDQPKQPYPSLLKEFTKVLDTAAISQSTDLSAKWQCQEMVYIFGEYISDFYPLAEILSTKGDNLCTSNQYLLRAVHTTSAHSTNGHSSDFESIYNSCLKLQNLYNSNSVALLNCKSAISRALAHYYFLQPQKAIAICSKVPSLQENPGDTQCQSLIFHEYFSQLRFISSTILKESTDETLIKHMEYIHQLTPEKICIKDNIPSCWEASMLYIDKDFKNSIPRYISSCAQIPHTEKNTCELGLFYLLGKLNNEFTQEEIVQLCAKTSNPDLCLKKVQNTNKVINKATTALNL